MVRQSVARISVCIHLTLIFASCVITDNFNLKRNPSLQNNDATISFSLGVATPVALTVVEVTEVKKKFL